MIVTYKKEDTIYTAKTKVTKITSLLLNNRDIEKVESIGYLGIQITQNRGRIKEIINRTGKIIFEQRPKMNLTTKGKDRWKRHVGWHRNS